MLAQFSKTELEVICMTVAIAVSHAMFSARFDRGAMSAADRFIGCAVEPWWRQLPGQHEHYRRK
jgi:hypothetical protein